MYALSVILCDCKRGTTFLHQSKGGLVLQQAETMRYPSQVRPISDLKANAAEVLAQLAEQHEPMLITQKR